MTEPMAVTIFHPTSDPVGFSEWADGLHASAEGAVELRVSMLDQPHLDWGVAVSFPDENELNDWLDSPEREECIRDGERRGILRATSDLVISADGAVPAGVGVFRHAVASGREAEFVSAETRLAEASMHFPGFEGCCLFAPEPDEESISMLRFRTERHLMQWLKSDERTEALDSLRSSLTREFSMVSSTTTFGTTVRTENGRVIVTPKWKTAMLILLVLYPTVMLLSRFLGPVFDSMGAAPWLAMWLSQVISLIVLQWALMPLVGSWFRNWLDPVDGAGWRVSAMGAVVMLVGYLVTLGVFATVHWLQYWDYGP